MEFQTKRYFVISLFLGFIFTTTFAQDSDAILKKAIAKSDLVNDYVVDLNIKINVDFIEIPRRKVKLFYKKPNQFHYETKGFALIPKQAQSFGNSDFRGNMSSVYVKEDIYENKKVHVIKAIPLDEDSPFVLATMWIDATNFNIHKMESVTRNDGTYKLFFQYTNHPFDLPDFLEIEFELSKMDLPMGMDGSFDIDFSKKDKGDKKTTGNVQIKYSNYIVNKGIDDSVFKSKK
jgi:outer membrane lipoprotein-sorting protein